MAAFLPDVNLQTRGVPASELLAGDLLAVFQCSPAAQLLVKSDDPAFTVLAVSEGYLLPTGETREALVGHPVSVCLAQEDALKALLQTALDSKAGQTLTTAQGTIIRSTPVISDGRVACILLSLESVAERPLEASGNGAARDLQASEQRLRLAQRAARMGSFEWLIPQGKIIWSPELEALYGLAEGAFEGDYSDWSKRVIAEDAAKVTEVIQQAWQRKEDECSYEYRALLPDGTERWMRGQTRIFYSLDGKPERMIGATRDITLQKHAEAELRDKEQRLRAIFDGTFTYLALLSPDGMVLETNRAGLEFARTRREDVIGKFVWEMGAIAQSAGLPERIQKAVAEAGAGKSNCFEARVCRPDSDISALEFSFYPIRSAGGDVVLTVAEARDITERKLAEERLQQQWQTFDTALSNSPDLVYTFDLEGRFTYANRQLCRVSQRSLKDTVGRTPLELGYPPDLAARIQRQIRQIVETGQSLRSQTAFTLPTGEVREYEYIYAPVIGESGVVEAIAGATRDITEQKEAEEQLRRSEARFHQLFDALPQLVWSSTSEGYDDLYNTQWFEYTGLSYEDVQGDGAHIIHPEDLPEATKRWQHALATGEPYEVEYRLRRFDGEYRWFLGRARPVLDKQGRVLRWFGTCTDIHEKREAEAALQKAHKELEEFSYVASHDLQEPLRMVSIYTQLILNQLGSQEGKLSDYSAFVRQGVARMESLLRDLMKFSRAVHEEVVIGSADLSASLAEAMSVLKTRIEETGAVIRVEPLPSVKGDAAQLAHVFQNLLSNAFKYRHKDRTPEIEISSIRQAEDCIVAVRDNGIGFDPRYAERIFGLFKRLHKDEYPGTGLGLAICQRIVERYGGRMWAEGRPGDGATFYFSLPLDL